MATDEKSDMSYSSTPMLNAILQKLGLAAAEGACTEASAGFLGVFCNG